MDLQLSKWKEFRISDIFSCSTTKAVSYDEIIPGNRLYITRSALNNGCSGFIEDNPSKLVKGNCITIGAEGKVAFYQKDDFLAGVKVYTLRSKQLNESNGLFIATLLNKNCYKYSYGRARILSNIEDENILLPVDEGGNPDWEFMSSYVENIKNRERESGLSIKNSLLTKNNLKCELEKKETKEFYLKDLFNIKLSKGDIKEDLVECGKIPLVSSGSQNNGIVKYITENGDGKAEMFPGECLTLDMFCNCFYQPKPFYAVSHGRVNILIPKIDLTKNALLYIATLLGLEKNKFSYGRAVYSTVAENIKILLPVVRESIDVEYMEKVIARQPFGDRI